MFKAADSLSERWSDVFIYGLSVHAVPQWALFDTGLLDLPDGGGGEMEFCLQEVETGEWKQGLYVDTLVLAQLL